MAIKCVTYGGPIGWFLRKHFSRITSGLYLEFQYNLRKKLLKKYIEVFNKNGSLPPCLISIETINKCNGVCSFCPANKHADKRPFKRMKEELFFFIIEELKKLNYSGYLNLYVNNEPFMDKRIEEWYKYAKENLPNAKMLLYTNGELLTKQRFLKIIPYIDKMIINNYSENLKLHTNISEIYDFVKSDRLLNQKDITIQIRYSKEILTNRAGCAPNKQTNNKIHKICIMPFTDITIFPDGTIGMCCSDATEETNFGKIQDIGIKNLWNSQTYKKLRETLGKDRSLVKFCEECDFVDAGIRNTFIKSRLLANK